MTPARFALSDAFGIFLHGSDQDAFAHIDRLQEEKQKSLPKKKRAKPIRYEDREGVRVIAELPEVRIATGKNTWVGRTSTNHRCAVAVDAGRLMSAALNQDEIKARWLEYCYDPYFEIDPDRQRRRFEQAIFPGICMLWAFWPHKRVRPTPHQLNRFLMLTAQCIYSYSRFVRCGIESTKTTASAKAAAMGYGSILNGKARGAWDASNWSRDWQALDADLMRMLEWLDETAIAPVDNALRRQVEARRAERGYMIA
ncbi:MAG: hypothetical protein GY862_26985 [Gammaproteobacteria bacterium]|nr:hypothetical protein [Gammaproteobacteria bacterium]MCP5013839.1 hypothetical protein [Ketobacter sp.]